MKSKLTTKILSLLMPILFLNVSALAIDLSDYKDFSSRSLIMNNQNNLINQEQKELLKSKKLSPDAFCLIEQIKKNNIENVKILLEFKTNPNQSYMEEYPIYIAAKENNFEILKLLYEHGAKLDKSFYSELYEAVKHKNNEMAQFLIDKKANIHYIDSVTQNSILYLAIKNNMANIAQQLIEKGADINFKTLKLIKKKKLDYLLKNVN